MELPISLKTLPPEAVDIMRYYGTNLVTSAHADDIMRGTGLSDRGFGKAIRRLVTKYYLAMDGDQVYRLSDAGKRVLGELIEYDLDPEAEDDDTTSEAITPTSAGEPRFVRRRVVVALPSVFAVGQPTNVFVGFHAAAEDEWVNGNMPVVLRVSLIHGEPATASESALLLENQPVRQVFEVTPANFTRVRLRVQVCQTDGHGALFDEDSCGGLYADAEVYDDATTSELIAYSADVMLRDDSATGSAVAFDEYNF